MTPMSPPSTRAVTARTLMISRVSVTSNGSVPSRATVTVISVPASPRMRLTASFSVRPTMLSPSMAVRIVARLDAGARGGRAVDRGDDADDAFFAGDFDAEAAVLAAGLRLHVAVVGRVHVGGVRVERGEHAVDGRFHRLRFVDLGDVVLLNARQHVGEQFELAVDVAAVAIAGRRPGQRAHTGRQAGHRRRNPSYAHLASTPRTQMHRPNSR